MKTTKTLLNIIISTPKTIYGDGHKIILLHKSSESVQVYTNWTWNHTKEDIHLILFHQNI